MIGRQFSYYCNPEDLETIETRVIRPLGGRILRIDKIEGREELREEERYSLPLEKMGMATLSLVLAPPVIISLIKYDGPWLNMEFSHLIEIGRCYIKSGIIRPARFWYVPKTYVDRVNVDKPHEFLNWAQAVYKDTKKLLSKQRFGENGQYADLFGPCAWREIASGNLTAAPN